jgi:hypothetical protein
MLYILLITNPQEAFPKHVLFLKKCQIMTFTYKIDQIVSIGIQYDLKKNNLIECFIYPSTG